MNKYALAIISFSVFGMLQASEAPQSKKRKAQDSLESVKAADDLAELVAASNANPSSFELQLALYAQTNPQSTVTLAATSQSLKKNNKPVHPARELVNKVFERNSAKELDNFLSPLNIGYLNASMNEKFLEIVIAEFARQSAQKKK